MTTTRALLAASSAALLGATLLTAAPAAAAEVGCGDTLLADTALTHDLVCGPGDGLRIGADGITLDLKGYTIQGPGAYGAGAGGGVRAARVSGFEIRNGTITGYAEGVVLDQASDGYVWNLVLRGNDRGVNLAGGGGHVVEKNTIAGNGRDAVRLGLSTGNTVQKNVLDANYYGIGVADASSGNLVAKNVVTRTSTDGVWVTADSTGTRIEKNIVSGNGDDGIDTDSAATFLVKNVAVGNGDLGIEAVAGVTDGGENLASGNGNPAQCTGVACTPVS